MSDGPNEQGFYEIRWSENGRSKRRSTGKRTLKEAQRFYADFIIAKTEDERLGADLHRPTVKEVVDVYADEHGPKTMPDTQAALYYNRGHLANGCLAGQLVEHLTEREVAKYAAQRAAGSVSWEDQGKTRGGRAAGPTTVRQELKMLQAAINYCIRNRVFSGLTKAQAPTLTAPAASLPRELWLTKDQAFKLLAAAQPVPGRLTPLYRFIAIGMFTASRKEPIMSLTWDRVTFTPEGGFIDFQEPQRRRTRKRRGVVPMNAALARILKQAFLERTGDYVLDSDADRTTPFRVLLQKTLGIKAGPHVLRHSWATWAAQDGVSMFDIAGVMHDSVATVEKRYAKQSPGHLRKAVNAVHMSAEIPGIETPAEDRHWPAFAANG